MQINRFYFLITAPRRGQTKHEQYVQAIYTTNCIFKYFGYIGVLKEHQTIFTDMEETQLKQHNND